ncbi:MAG: DUF4382 domain-containing protein [Bacteroidales bacterium]|nr:DUF4382 domain-containing protein [Bacteroidales bacterium]
MKKLFFALFTSAFIVLLSSCSDKINNNNNEPGRLVVKVTDAPFPIDFIDSAAVTIIKVEIRKAGDGIADGNPFMVIFEDTITLNLVELRNGIVDELLDIEIPQGKYDLIRLYVDKASLKIKDGDSYNVKVPSGQQTGIKVFIEPAINVEGGLTSELLIDFDLSRSFVMRGNLHKPSGINGFIFKPVIRAVNSTTAGRIAGMVTDTAKIKIKNPTVWVKQDTVVATTVGDTLGHYAIIGLPAGTYSVHATKENYDTVSFTGVKVVEGNLTVQNFILKKK